jgi:hypothetical protein
MTDLEFRAEMLRCAVSAGKALCEYVLEDTKKEPEQVRKNVTTILTLLTETESFFKDFRIDKSNSEI